MTELEKLVLHTILENESMLLGTVKRYFELLEEAGESRPNRVMAIELLGGQIGKTESVADMLYSTMQPIRSDQPLQ